MQNSIFYFIYFILVKIVKMVENGKYNNIMLYKKLNFNIQR